MQGQASSTAQKLPRLEIQLQTSSPSQHPFRVCTFNVLADGLAQSGDFVKVPISCLQWEHRLPLILQEIWEADADIICLQELNHFDVLAAALVPEGYSCFFRAKKPSPATKFGFPADGIALFYRHSRFSCSPAPEAHCFQSIDGQPAAQGFVTALLHDKQADKHVLVAVTHLKAKAGADNEQTRVHQVQQLLQEVEHMQERHMQLQQQQQPAGAAGSSGNGSSSRAIEPAAVLLCGDLNTIPDSDTVRTLLGHKLGLNSIWDVAWAPGAAGRSNGSNGSNGKHGSNGKGSLQTVQPTNGSSSSSGLGNGKPSSSVGAGAAAAAAAASGGSSNGHQSDAGAATTGSSNEKGKPAAAQQGCEFTTWKFRSNGVAKRTIDYVWYTGAQLVPVSRWRMLSEAEIGPAGLPSPVYPSDHMAVTCQLAWVDRRSRHDAAKHG
jgi:nocturnin